jgi:hypothetical protein
MRTILTFIIATIVVLPAVAIFNDNGILWVNFMGLAYIMILYLISMTKVGKKGLKCLNDANNELSKWLEK